MESTTVFHDHGGALLGIQQEALVDIRYPLYALVFVFLAALLVYEPKKKQKYADVPIHGIKAREELPQARQRFRSSAQRILLEGYNKVPDFNEVQTKRGVDANRV